MRLDLYLGQLGAYRTGLIPSVDGQATCAPFTSAALPETQWVLRNLRPFAGPDEDQNGYGACCSFATTTVAEIAYYLSGMGHIQFNPWWLYANMNRGRDAGSNPWETLEFLKATGLCPLSAVQGRVDRVYRTQYTDQEWQALAAAAKPYSTLDSERISKDGEEAWLEIGTAITEGDPVVIGIGLAQDFDRLDAGGVAGLSGRTVGYHAMAVVGTTRVTTGPHRGQLAHIVKNSWKHLPDLLLVERHYTRSELNEHYRVKLVDQGSAA